MLRFKAHAIAVEEVPDANVFVVVISEGADGNGCRLEFQRSQSFDEQDRILGQDTYCISTDTGATHYGGVHSWWIEDAKLTVKLDENASRTLGIDSGYAIELDSADVTALASGLERVIGLPTVSDADVW